MTTAESVIEEIRESRRRMSRDCGHDPSKLIDYIQTFNRKYASQVEEYRKRHAGQPITQSADESVSAR